MVVVSATKVSKKVAPKKNVPKTTPPPPPPPPSAPSSTLEFFLDDFAKTLFPLKTNRVLIHSGEADIKDYIAKCLDPAEEAFAFGTQRRAYAAKPGFHVRRTIKLDPVAEYYIYDIVFRNRSRFRSPHTEGRTHYGYRFESGRPIAATAAYKAFKGALSEYERTYSHSMSMDVASYFNTVYHHDLVSWFAELGAEQNDYEGLGQLLRQIASGRSIDCLPQGLYPTKMIGNDFLRFVDNFSGLRSEKIVRFMDDIYLFANEQRVLADDFQIIQQLLGNKSLSINPQKTRHGDPAHATIDTQIDAVKAKLLKRRRYVVTTGYDEDDRVVQEHLTKWPLSDEELQYITALLEKQEIEEEDAELILTIMRNHAHRVEKRLPELISSFPILSKSVYGFCAGVDDKELVASIISDVASSGARLMEYQLFWFGAILEDHLMGTAKAGSLVSLLYEHPSATALTKAKILEIADRRFGLQEMRDDILLSGQSDWPAWASAVGSAVLQPTSRNHKLKYFGNLSQLNHLIATIVMRLP